MMKRIAAVIGITAFFMAAPLKAQMSEEQKELTIMNTSRLMGWIQASCFYAEGKYISPYMAELTIEAMLNVNTRNSNVALTNGLIEVVLEKEPQCKIYFPKKYLPD